MLALLAQQQTQIMPRVCVMPVKVDCTAKALLGAGAIPLLQQNQAVQIVGWPVAGIGSQCLLDFLQSH